MDYLPAIDIKADSRRVEELLCDVGGWRIWNRKIVFAELDSECQERFFASENNESDVGNTTITHTMNKSGLPKGIIVLRRLPFLTWKLTVQQYQPGKSLNVCIHKWGLRVSWYFEFTAIKKNFQQAPVTRVIAGFESNLNFLAKPISVLPFTQWWNSALKQCLTGLPYAAENGLD